MSECDCNCECEPDSISFWWMNDNHTFVRLKGRNLTEIVYHARKCHKADPCGMLCCPKLMVGNKSVSTIGEPVHGGKMFDKEILEWKNKIEKNVKAMELITKKKFYI